MKLFENNVKSFNLKLLSFRSIKLVNDYIIITREVNLFAQISVYMLLSF